MRIPENLDDAGRERLAEAIARVRAWQDVHGPILMMADPAAATRGRRRNFRRKLGLRCAKFELPEADLILAMTKGGYCVKPPDREVTFEEAAAAAEDLLKRIITGIITRDAKFLHTPANIGTVARVAIAKAEVESNAGSEKI